jgi:ribosomal protein S19E (S16A)
MKEERMMQAKYGTGPGVSEKRGEGPERTKKGGRDVQRRLLAPLHTTSLLYNG